MNTQINSHISQSNKHNLIYRAYKTYIALLTSVTPQSTAQCQEDFTSLCSKAQWSNAETIPLTAKMLQLKRSEW